MRLFCLFILLLTCWRCDQPKQFPPVDRYPVQVGKRFGFIDEKGNMAIKPQFHSVEWFNDNRAIVQLEAGKKVMIDKQGRTVFQDTSGYLQRMFTDGLIRFDKKDGVATYIDTLGQERFYLSASIVDSDHYFSEERLRVRLFNRRFAFLDTNGNVAFEVNRGFPGRFSEGLVRINFNGRTCYLDKSGKRKFCVKGQGYDFAGWNGLAMVVENKKTYFINKQGKVALQDFRYDSVAQFINGFAKVEKNGKKGFIDRKGREAIPPVYEDATFFSSGLVAVKRSGEDWIFVNEHNEQVIEQSFDEITMPGFIGELAYVYTKSTQGYINRQGIFVWISEGNNLTNHLSKE